MNKRSVPEELCIARREVLVERIEGLKRTIYVTVSAAVTIIVFV